jgi:hypothetical protein
MGGLRSNHRGEVGGCVLWLAARVAQYRCKSEWTHLPCRDECVHSDHPLENSSGVSADQTIEEGSVEAMARLQKQDEEFCRGCEQLLRRATSVARPG